MSMKTAAAFERSLAVATAGLSPEQISARLAVIAKDALSAAISSGEAPNRYVRSVNGRVGAAEESVEAPGPIVYQFSYLEEAALYALKFAQLQSPVLSGAYRKSWFVMVDGKVWVEGADIPLGAEVIVTNDRPYHRKVDVGAMKGMRVPPHIIDVTMQQLRRLFGNSIKVQSRFVTLKDGYVLKGRHVRRGAALARRGGARKDTRAGQQITYPALVITIA
ncbi:MAG TPA: hypothetical protein VGO34_14905 [Alphaproteobacteria bacterium]|jgi:hypothetical protein